ncbi:MAG: hypothetical protein ABDH23_00185 [Endomicrobiia bacterium]
MAKIYCRISRRLQIFVVIFFVGILVFNNIFSETQIKSSQSSSYAKAIKDLTKKLEDLQNQLDEVTQKLSSNTQDIKETSSSLIELNKKIEKINNDILDILKKIEALSQEISFLKRENIEIRQQIETQKTSQEEELLKPAQQITVDSSKDIDFNDFQVLNKRIEELKKEVQEIKETQKLQMVSEIKDPNLKRIISSPYFILSTFFISIFALLAAF